MVRGSHALGAVIESASTRLEPNRPTADAMAEPPPFPAGKKAATWYCSVVLALGARRSVMEAPSLPVVKSMYSNRVFHPPGGTGSRAGGIVGLIGSGSGCTTGETVVLPVTVSLLLPHATSPTASSAPMTAPPHILIKLLPFIASRMKPAIYSTNTEH